MEEIMDDRLLSVHDLSDLTGWHLMTVYKKARDGEIPGRIVIGKNSLRFKEAEVRRWLGLTGIVSQENTSKQIHAL
jgi:excisionase family DNA binding protein